VTPLSAIDAKGYTVRMSATVINPDAVAQVPALPDKSAEFLATYGTRPGVAIIRMSVVSATKKITKSSFSLLAWDVLAFPAYPILNCNVLAFSDAQVGNTVGNGECWTLAAKALTSAGARGADGYTFGRKLADGETPYPGDIFQFTSAKFEGHDGNTTWWKTLGMPNHTAVLRRVLGPKKFEILEQNPGPVKTDVIDFNDLTSGKWELWRPIPPEN